MTVVGAVVQGPKEIGDVDTDDEKDEEAQYEQWKSRELARIRCALSRTILICQLEFVHALRSAQSVSSPANASS